MKTFHITSTISIEAESRDAVIDMMNSDKQKEIAFDLLDNAEVDEA